MKKSNVFVNQECFEEAGSNAFLSMPSSIVIDKRKEGVLVNQSSNIIVEAHEATNILNTSDESMRYQSLHSILIAYYRAQLRCSLRHVSLNC
jgi:hypothetical protein